MQSAALVPHGLTFQCIHSGSMRTSRAVMRENHNAKHGVLTALVTDVSIARLFSYTDSTGSSRYTPGNLYHVPPWDCAN